MPVDFFTVAVHEIGHSLGLSHSPDHNSIMFPYYKGKEDGDNFDIGYDDILAMFELYSEFASVSYIHSASTFDNTDIRWPKRWSVLRSLRTRMIARTGDHATKRPPFFAIILGLFCDFNQD